jgi:phosphate transport system substrate-binding protein
MKIQKTVAAVLVLGVAAMTTVQCGRSASSVTLAGSTAFQPFAEKLAEHYMVLHPGTRITVQGGGSAVGIQSALSGAAQIGMADLVSLPPEANELQKHVVARDGIAMVVHPSNPVSSITTDNLRLLFNGKIRNWKELGGNDAPITVVSREAGSGTRSSFEEIIKNVELMQDAIIQDSNGTVRETVANDANAVGYLSFGLVNDKIKALDVDGYSCSSENILQGHYALVRPIFFLTNGDLQPAVKDFIDFVLSEEGQTMIHESGLLTAR